MRFSNNVHHHTLHSTGLRSLRASNFLLMILSTLFFTLLTIRSESYTYQLIIYIWIIWVGFFSHLILPIQCMQLVQKSFARLMFNDFVRSARFSSYFFVHWTKRQITNLFSFWWLMESFLLLQLRGWGCKRKIGSFCSLDWWRELPEPWSGEGVSSNMYTIHSVLDGDGNAEDELISIRRHLNK